MMPRASEVTNGMDILDTQYEALRDGYAVREQICADYVMYKDGPTYYADHCLGSGIDYDGTNSVTVLQSVLDDGIPDGGVVYLKKDVEVDGQVTIKNSNTTILSNLYVVSPTVLPAIRQIKLDASSGALTGIRLQGLYIRELDIASTGNYIRNVSVDQCYFAKNATYHGIIFEGDGTSSGWQDHIIFNQCYLTLGGGESNTWGLVTWKNVIWVTSIHFTECSFATYGDNNVFFLVLGTGQAQGVNVTNGKFYTDTATAGVELFHVNARTLAGSATGLYANWIGGQFESHTPITYLNVDNSVALALQLRFMATNVWLNPSTGTTATICNNANANWHATSNAFIFSDNYHMGAGTLALGTLPTAAATMKIKVRGNQYFTTENSGTDTITNPATSQVVAHGLDVTPTVDDFTITLAENPTNALTAVWVDTIGAANFTVNCEPAPGASNLDFGWRVVVL